MGGFSVAVVTRSLSGAARVETYAQRRLLTCVPYGRY
jgi:hypothetical protein